MRRVCVFCFDALVGFLDHAVGQRFIKPEHLGMLLDPDSRWDCLLSQAGGRTSSDREGRP